MSFVTWLVSLALLMLGGSMAAPAADGCVGMERTLTAQELHTILGKWVLVEGYTNHKVYEKRLKGVSSSQVEFVTSDNQTFTLRKGHMWNGTCVRYSQNFTASGNNLTLHGGRLASSADFLKTCPDCMLMQFHKNTSGEQFLLIYGRTGKLQESELERIRKQAECIGFNEPPPFTYDGVSELCLDERETTDA